MNDHHCPVCSGTGMTRSGYLDCMAPGCDAATRRARFNDRLRDMGILPSTAAMLDIVWTTYNMDREPSHGRQ